MLVGTACSGYTVAVSAAEIQSLGAALCGFCIVLPHQWWICHYLSTAVACLAISRRVHWHVSFLGMLVLRVELNCAPCWLAVGPVMRACICLLEALSYTSRGAVQVWIMLVQGLAAVELPTKIVPFCNHAYSYFILIHLVFWQVMYAVNYLGTGPVSHHAFTWPHASCTCCCYLAGFWGY